ncbi:uncharacterized protein TRUGW13939_09146 [Talaromyces rugulosus]|uniref:FAD-binding domain-containing protein n=1 Tax=Talaromyces rugulosus TaxID=121627 RepID=A0A7H8R6K7_TALRU|nr:uncharacterized protein TRUGW13939_09146 [Talaromyces rugulosus]QKX61990.1 hypothetical protein TRUGW13939_09146 [Talaromyces rugulosus]
MSTKPTVLIIGGGIGGLALGQMLRKNSIPFRIFDRDASSTARRQGWCMTLHWVINDIKANFPEDILPLLDTVSHLDNYGTACDAALYNGGTGNKNIHLSPTESNPFIRANRAKLRGMLSTNLTVEFDKQFEHYEETDSGVTAFFSDGSLAKGDILVGADGSHSLVRQQLLGSEHSKNYSLPMEVCMGETTLTKPQYEKIFTEFAKSWYAAETRANFFCGLHGVSDDKETARYYWMTVQQKNTRDKTSVSNLEYYHRATQAVKGIHSKFLMPLYNTTPEGMVNPPLSLEDFIPPKEGLPKGRVTLLGDSLHLMTPFKGSGGNLAIKDGLDLASLIANSGENIPALLQEYASLAIPRATELVLESRTRTEVWTGDNN